jgi:hypothetical protein
MAFGAPACDGHEKGPRKGAFGFFGMSEEGSAPLLDFRTSAHEKARRGFPPAHSS